MIQQRLGLGDFVERALSSVGITKERVSKWLGGECACKQRQDKLNSLGAWAKRILMGRAERAGEHLDKLLEE